MDFKRRAYISAEMHAWPCAGFQLSEGPPPPTTDGKIITYFHRVGLLGGYGKAITQLFHIRDTRPACPLHIWGFLSTNGHLALTSTNSAMVCLASKLVPYNFLQ